ncbi:MAG: MBL fold metallo-hydrolase [Oscillospiraceae bacterium]|nr:MBL fold metallo-hydrolase [Oscillospiraceae bacterium]
MKKTKKADGLKLSAVPKILLAVVIAAGLILAALIETNVITVRQIERFFRLIDEETVPTAPLTDLPEKAERFCVTVVDVGQGDCIIIQAAEKTILIDSGEYDHFADVEDLMHLRGISFIDMIIVTHQHTDHMGAMSEIIENHGVGRIIIPDVPDDMIPSTMAYEKLLMSAEKKGIRLTPAVCGYVYKLTEIDGIPVTLSILSPLPGMRSEDLNDYSVCSRLDYGNISWLFTGDLTQTGEEMLISSGADIDVTALKVGHHGSDTSSGRLFLKKTSPSLAVISCGKNNDYGHPSEDTLRRISKYTDRIYRTDESGDISVYSDGKKLYVRKEK